MGMPGESGVLTEKGRCEQRLEGVKLAGGRKEGCF